MNPFLRALVAAGLLDQDTADRMSRAMSPEQAQAYAEQRMAALWSSGLQGQLARLMEVIRANEYNFPPQVMEAFWRREDRTLFESVVPGLRDVAQDAAITAAVRGGGFTMWNAVNERVIGWVEDYYINPDAGAFGSIPNLNNTARTIVGNAFNAWQRGELEVPSNAQGLPRLVLALEPAFGPERASRIAITETTRIFAESEWAAAEADENAAYIEWMTANDELVCPICGPLNGRRVPKGDPAGFTALGAPTAKPPAHVNCRCSATSLSDLAAQAIDGTLPEPKTGPQAPTWKPNMSRADAERWAAESTYRDTVYHVTSSASNERSIRADGFDLSRKKFGRAFGDGVYVGMNPETVETYRRWTGPAAKTLPIKINVQRVLVYDASGRGAERDFIPAIARQAAKESGIKLTARDIQRKILDQGDNGISEFLKGLGYDALHVRDPRALLGGNQMVVFDPRKVVVIDD